MGGNSSKTSKKAPPPTDTILKAPSNPNHLKTLLLLGGYEHGQKPTDNIHMLVYDTWKPMALKLPFSGVYFGAVTLNGELFVFGGETNELYKLTDGNKKWTKMCEMVEKRSGISNSSLEFEGSIWVMGGTDNGALKTVEKYDPEKNSWMHVPPMNEYRSGAGAAVANGKIFVCGGFNGFDTLDSVEFFDPASQLWTLFPSPMPDPRFGLAVVSDGHSLVAIGGFDQEARGTVWKCNVELEKPVWMPLRSLSHPRHYFTANILRDEIVVAGGKADGALTRVEIFNANDWREAINLPRAYYGHCCVLFSSKNTNF